VTTHHVFDQYVEVANRWLATIARDLDLDASERRRALRALRAGLHAIRDRLPAAEVLDLGAQLPTLIRGLYYEGWTLANDPTVIRTRSAIVERVERELGLDPQLDPIDVLRAVILLLAEHVSPGEIEDVMSTLPRPIKTLWDDVIGNERETITTRLRARRAAFVETYTP
jgi:uncharacterized protein (DUF2267 family)